MRLKKFTVLMIVALGVFYTLGATIAFSRPYEAPQASKVKTLLIDWRDPARDRTLPIKIYYPATGEGPFPVVIVSHGLGGSREGLAVFGAEWASRGYVSVHVQHVGSDEGVWKNKERLDAYNALMKAANAQQYVARCKDVSFVIDELERRNKIEDFALAGKLDLNHIAIAGHSFGARTVLAICGQTDGRGKGLTLADPRVKAGIAFSPAPPNAGDVKTAFADVKVPIFHWTGTEDDSRVAGDAKPKDRRVPFDSIVASDQYLVIFNGADHMTFGGRNASGGKNKTFHALINEGTDAFLDAYLRQDEHAKNWLATNFKTELGTTGTFEEK